MFPIQHIEKQLALAARPYDLDSLPWKRKLLSPILILFMWLSSILTIFVLKFAAQPGLSFVSFVISVINVNFATGFPFLHVAALCWATHLLYGRLSCVMERVTGRYTFEDEVDEELGRTSRITIIQVKLKYRFSSVRLVTQPIRTILTYAKRRNSISTMMMK